MRDYERFPSTRRLLDAFRINGGPHQTLASFGAVDEPTADGERLHYGGGVGSRHNPPFRWVGYADELNDGTFRGIEHTGYFGDEYGEGWDVWRGVVLRIPSRSGEPWYVVGAEWGEGTGRGFDSGGGFVEYGGRWSVYHSLRDAVYAADECARITAEESREAAFAARELEEEHERRQRDAATIRCAESIGMDCY